MRFVFSHSHAYRGAQVQVEAENASEGTCQVDFGDGVSVLGACRTLQDGSHELDIPAYRTGRGHEVVARSWRIVPTRPGPDRPTVWRARSRDAG